MRVMMVNRHFYPFLGGVEFHILNLAQELLRLGCDVTVTCLGDSTEAKIDDFRGIRIRRVRAAWDLGVIEQERPDVIHVHMPRNAIAFAALLEAHRRGIGTVFTPHCFYPSRSTAKAALKRLCDASVTPVMFRLADLTINLTANDQRDSITRGLPKAKSVIIPNSIRGSELDSVRRPPDFRSKHGIEGDFLVHVGRFDPVKQIDFLVRCQRDLPSELKLVLIGQDGGTLAEIRRLIGELSLERQVIVIERASFPELCAAYAEAAALVMASEYEGLPTVILEALYFGCPVVASRVGGIPHVLTEGWLGLQYSFLEREAYVYAVRTALTQRGERRSDRQSWVKRNYSWEENAPLVLRAYEHVARASRSQAA
jgi:glycosyltransferase involved in cell wall biosynthesis